MARQRYTVLACDTARDGTQTYTVVRDDGRLSTGLAREVLLRLLAHDSDDAFTNCTSEDFIAGKLRFPSSSGGDTAGTIVFWDKVGDAKVYRVYSQVAGQWICENLFEDEVAVRLRKGLVAGAGARGKKVTQCAAPFMSGVLKDVQRKTTSEAPKGTSTVLHFVTEAVSEGGDRLRYAGIELTGLPDDCTELVNAWSAQSVMFREAYFSLFQHRDESLAMRTAPGRLYVVVPYSILEGRLRNSRAQVRLTRVIVSSLSIVGGRPHEEAYIVLAGVLGRGSVKGSSGLRERDVTHLADELLMEFRAHVHLHTKIKNKGDQPK